MALVITATTFFGCQNAVPEESSTTATEVQEKSLTELLDDTADDCGFIGTMRVYYNGKIQYECNRGFADEDKEEALPLAKRFYDLGFNLEATTMTAEYMRENGVRVRLRRKLSEGSTEILDSIRAGYVSYVVNTRAILSGVHYEDGVAIRKCASEHRVTMFTSLDTVRVLLDVLEEMTIGVSPI